VVRPALSRLPCEHPRRHQAGINFGVHFLSAITESTILACPCAKKTPLVAGVSGATLCTGAGCVHAQASGCFTRTQNVPILISFQNCDTVCQPEQYKADDSGTFYGVDRKASALDQKSPKRVPDTTSVTAKNCAKFVDLLQARHAQPRVLVIGSGTRGSGTEALWDNAAINKTGIDIYPSASTDYVADAHYLPFVDGAFDGVWIQAVLEHVVDPVLVVQQIHRVLAKGGIVYAETPFMQQVHEGAYDFQRFSVLGHRYLFRWFDAVDMGGTRGAGVVLAWSVRYLVWALTRSKTAAAIAAKPFAMLAGLLDRWSDPRAMWDSSSAVYFLGSRAEQPMRQSELPKGYRGLQV
jgi:SAM-dependent methyltransferase